MHVAYRFVFHCFLEGLLADLAILGCLREKVLSPLGIDAEYHLASSFIYIRYPPCAAVGDLYLRSTSCIVVFTPKHLEKRYIFTTID